MLVFACVPELKKSKNTFKSIAYKHLYGVSHLPVSGCGRLADLGVRYGGCLKRVLYDVTEIGL